MSTRAKNVPTGATSFEAPTSGSFTFKIGKALEVLPEMAPTIRASKPYPWVAAFEHLVHNQDIFIPTAYWTAPEDKGGRGLDPNGSAMTKDKGYVKQKVRESFKKWKEADPSRDNRSIVMVNRDKGDHDSEGGTFEEPGISVFMQISKAG